MALQDFTLNLKANTLALDKSIKSVTDRTYTVKVKADGSSVKTLTQDVTSADGKLQGVGKTVEKVNAQGKVMNTTYTQTGKVVKSLGADFLDTAGKVAKFGAITAVIGAFTGAVAEAGKTVKEFDDAMTDLRKVSDLEGQALDDYTKKLGELGETVARSRTEMTQNATIFKQAGYSDDDAATLARVAA